MNWTHHDMASQEGKRFLITGANSGIGLEAAWMLADAGAHVVLACRSESKIEGAKREIREKTSRGTLDGRVLDLASLQSIRRAASTLDDELDGLLNNAGVMMLPRSLTEDGFEMQFGVNHLGHFALSAALMDRLSPNARVVTVSSNAHKPGRIAFDDLMGERRYSRFAAYCQSKLANLLFALELQ
ncbi:MAG: SDR family NAD(P)-dependent oxidoreductase, partial [Myxococcota bacterium]